MQSRQTAYQALFIKLYTLLVSHEIDFQNCSVLEDFLLFSAGINEPSSGRLVKLTSNDDERIFFRCKLSNELTQVLIDKLNLVFPKLNVVNNQSQLSMCCQLLSEEALPLIDQYLKKCPERALLYRQNSLMPKRASHELNLRFLEVGVNVYRGNFFVKMLCKVVQESSARSAAIRTLPLPIVLQTLVQEYCVAPEEKNQIDLAKLTTHVGELRNDPQNIFYSQIRLAIPLETAGFIQTYFDSFTPHRCFIVEQMQIHPFNYDGPLVVMCIHNSLLVHPGFLSDLVAVFARLSQEEQDHYRKEAGIIGHSTNWHCNELMKFRQIIGNQYDGLGVAIENLTKTIATIEKNKQHLDQLDNLDNLIKQLYANISDIRHRLNAEPTECFSFFANSKRKRTQQLLNVIEEHIGDLVRIMTVSVNTKRLAS